MIKGLIGIPGFGMKGKKIKKTVNFKNKSFICCFKKGIKETKVIEVKKVKVALMVNIFKSKKQINPTNEENI